MRLALGLEYDGSGFRGWQLQGREVRTVQGCLEQALSRVAGGPVATICAGRTDAGVHATAQVVHFDTEAERSPRSWILGGNSNLPADISILWARPVAPAFHARFAALARRYRYIILNRPYRSALHHRRVAWQCQPLDVEVMALAAGYLLGEHDFSAFRAQDCQAKSPVRTLYVLRVQRQRDLIIIDAEANAFLQHMVRNIVGVLLAIGAGERPVHWVQEVLAARNRALGGVTAPAAGLYLVGVRYPAEFELPATPALNLPLSGHEPEAGPGDA
ncbi:MAG: tRNA pseudouridine(38-40) synthase TruA [Candidatus Competibacteraceae bacterium]